MGALSALKKAKPLVSKFDEALANLTRPKGTGTEFLTEVMKQPGVKKAEIEDRKLKQAFEKAGKITKEEAQEIAKKHAPAQLEEKVLREPSIKDIEERAHELAYDDAFDELRADGMNRHEATDVAAEMAEDRIQQYMDRAAEDLMESGASSQHGEWTLPGGENYREILLKMPAFAGDRKLAEMEAARRRLDPEFHSHRYNELTQQIDALKAEKALHPEQFQGVKQHFAGEPGIIASLRVKDRVGPKGEKVLHIEEIQSDWHQKGRSEGYKKLTPEENQELQALLKKEHEEDGLLPDDMARVRDLESRMGQGVPDAPFKKNWQELALKKALNYAVENGYDKIAITPGVEQADRYNLAKHIDDVFVSKRPNGLYDLSASKDGQVVFGKNNLKESQLEEYVGKDLAAKSVSDLQSPESYTHPTTGDVQKRYSDLDLQVGGEGMKGFYDKILPGYLNEFGKKYGAKVGELDIETHPAKVTPQVAAPGIDYFPEPITEPAQTKKVHSFDITPEMREEITTKGLPLYQQIGLPLGTGVGSYEFNAPEPEYAEGGAVNCNTQPDMNDGGAIIQGAPYKRGGKVKITDNLDEMFMEVNDKKFQRK